jgi:hypothetical protein
MSDDSNNLGNCIYCGKYATLTDDHIPPKNLFPKPRPSDLITVPSCSMCNLGASKDDEYLRLTLTLREDVFPTQAAQKVIPFVYRSLKKPKKIGFQQALFGSMREVYLRSRSGLYIGKRPAYDVDLKRINNVVERITKGLFYHEQEKPVPSNYVTHTFAIEEMEYFPPEPREYLFEKVFPSLFSLTPRVFGESVFSYQVMFSQDDENTSAWLMKFYDRVPFIGLTYTKLDNESA